MRKSLFWGVRRFTTGSIGVCVVFGIACGERGATKGATVVAPPPPVVAVSGVESPPPPRVESYVDTVRGVALPDPYRWLEDTLDAEGRAWVASQETFARNVLARTVFRDSLTALYEHAFRDAPTLDDVVETPAGIVLTRWLGDDPSLFARPRGSTNERLLRSVADIAKLGTQASMRALVPSPDGRLLAIGTTSGGDKNAAIALLDGATGAVLPDRIPDLLTSTSGTRYQVSWIPKEGAAADAFFYPRLWPSSASGPAADRLSRGRQFVHRVGTPQSADVPIFGFGVTPSVPIAPEDVSTRVYTARGSRWLVASVFRSRLNGSDTYAGRRTPGDTAVPAWTPLLEISDRAAFPLLRGDTAWVLSRKGADRGQIRRRVLGDGPAPSGQWETVVPEGQGVITAVALQNDALYFTRREGGALQLYVFPFSESRERRVVLPNTGTVRFAPRASEMDGVLISVQSWAMPPRWFRVEQGGTVVASLGIDDGSKASASPTLVSDRLEARSADGALVPVSFVYDSGALASKKLDGTAPLLIDAYGGFGQSTDPMYDPYAQVWTSLGGVYAYAHVRGGGELGDAWHQSATREHKQRSVDDINGAVEALIAGGYTSAGRVAIQGISFGAILPGLAAMQRPELFGVALYDVGGPDEIRAAAIDPTSARNIAEIGDVDTPEGIKSLRAVSPYHVVPARIGLPAVLLHSANDDYNFGTEMLVAKYVARLQAANTGNRPVVWVRTAGGHRWLASISPTWAATVASFLLWQTGDVRYQP